MKRIARTAMGPVLAGLVLLNPLHAETPAGQVDFGPLEPSKSRREFVEVNLQGPLLAMAAKVAGKDDPEIAQLLEGLKSVRVSVVGLGDDNRAGIQRRLGELRGQLDAAGWSAPVNVTDKDARVTVHVKARGGEALEGVVVLVEDKGRQAVMVNVVGDVKPAQLEKLGAKLDLAPLRHAGEAVSKAKK